jgi:flagellar biosynthesis chaperone FliJ
MAKQALSTLIRLAEFNIDEQRRQMNALLDRAEQLHDALQHLENRKLEEDDYVRRNPLPEQTFTYAGWLERYRTQRGELTAQITANAQAIDAKQRELEDSFRELKTYEITKRAAEKKAVKEREDKTQRELDDRQNSFKPKG